MTTSDATMDRDSFLPEADAIHRAIRAIVDARATGSPATWEGMELLEAAYGDKAFRYEKSIFRDNDGAHGRTPPTLPPPHLAWRQPGKRNIHPRRFCIDASTLTNDQVALLRAVRVHPVSGKVTADSGGTVDPQVESAARGVREVVRRHTFGAAAYFATDHSIPGFQVLLHNGLREGRTLGAADDTVRLLEGADEAAAEQSVLHCAAEADDGRLAANGALAAAGFLLGVTEVGWAALGVAAGNAVVACGCCDCDPPEHYTPRR